jgi:uncharacterized membrane protein HdeD (DUF308 family)
MTRSTTYPASLAQDDHWLKSYYAWRAAFSIVRVVAAFTAGRTNSVVATFLLIIYPAWDAAANYVDAQRNGGLRRNRTQSLNMIVSGATTAAVAIAIGISMHAVLGVFGVWAVLAGLFQLATGVRRWKSHGAQWAMILSGAQSMLAGGFFVVQANGAATPAITDIAVCSVRRVLLPRVGRVAGSVGHAPPERTPCVSRHPRPAPPSRSRPSHSSSSVWQAPLRTPPVG